MGRRRKDEAERKVRISVGLPKRMVEWLRRRGNVSAWIEGLIRREMERDEGKGPDS